MTGDNMRKNLAQGKGTACTPKATLAEVSVCPPTTVISKLYVMVPPLA
jgi:hypothetical protein